jgi:hypothetical protein
MTQRQQQAPKEQPLALEHPEEHTLKGKTKNKPNTDKRRI